MHDSKRKILIVSWLYICKRICSTVCWWMDTGMWRNEHELCMYYYGEVRVIRTLFIGGKICLWNIFLCLPVSLPRRSSLFGSGEDLGGSTVCHLVSKIDTKSFGCDLFELMVQNIVSTPTPRGNFIGALGRYKWPVVYLHGQHTHARPSVIHTSTCTYTYSHMYIEAKHPQIHTSPQT